MAAMAINFPDQGISGLLVVVVLVVVEAMVVAAAELPAAGGGGSNDNTNSIRNRSSSGIIFRRPEDLVATCNMAYNPIVNWGSVW